MNVSEIKTAIMTGNLTNEELSSIIDAVKFARSQNTKSVRRSLKIGDTVKFYNDRRSVDMVCTVEKVAIKFVTVRENGKNIGGLWRVPANMLEVVNG